MAFSISDMAAPSDQWEATYVPVGKNNSSWSVYSYSKFGNTRVFEIYGNHCTNIISKVIACVCSFFCFGKVIRTELPNRDGETESHFFWADRTVKATHAHLSIQREQTGWFYEKISPKQ